MGHLRAAGGMGAVVATLALCAGLAAGACPSSFLPGKIFDAGANAGMCVTADIDGDGNLDLTTGWYVLLGDGNGGFGAPIELPPGGIVFDAAVEDFDRDGHADIALVAIGARAMHVLFGREREQPGDDLFEPPVSLPCVEMSWHMACGDIDGNGTRDIIAGSAGEPALSIQLNRGDRTFESLRHEEMPQGTHAIALGDFDGDGHLDIASGGGSDAVLLFGKGDGTFGGMVVSPLLFEGERSDVHRFRAADFDGDGRADLVACISPGVTVYPGAQINRGAGLPAKAAVEVALDGRGRFIELADLSHDGLLDIVAHSERGGETELRVLCGKAPTPDAPVAFTVGEVFFPTLNRDMLVSAPGDVNGDGAIDIALVTEGDGASQILFGTDMGGPRSPGDANGDGTIDVADAVATLSHLFAHVQAPCPNVLEVNNDGRVDIADAVYVLAYLFAHGPAPVGAPRPCAAR